MTERESVKGKGGHIERVCQWIKSNAQMGAPLVMLPICSLLSLALCRFGLTLAMPH